MQVQLDVARDHGEEDTSVAAGLRDPVNEPVLHDDDATPHDPIQEPAPSSRRSRKKSSSSNSSSSSSSSEEAHPPMSTSRLVLLSGMMPGCPVRA